MSVKAMMEIHVNFRSFRLPLVYLIISLGGHICLDYTARPVQSPNECDFRTCDKDEGSIAFNITVKAKYSPRENASSYLVPTTNIENIVLIEQCYVACFDRVSYFNYV